MAQFAVDMSELSSSQVEAFLGPYQLSTDLFRIQDRPPDQGESMAPRDREHEDLFDGVFTMKLWNIPLCGSSRNAANVYSPPSRS